MGLVTPLHYISNRLAETANAPVLVVMHGYGADEHDLFSLAREIAPGAKVISLQAPTPLGFGGYSWYHLHQDESGLRGDDDSRRESEARVIASLPTILEKESASKEQVYLLGFSQGAAMSFSLVGLHDLSQEAGVTLRGVMALSGYVPKDVLAPLGKKALRRLPFFVGHGEYDDLVSPAALPQAEEVLRSAGAAVQSRTYPIGHGVTQQTLDDLRTWFAGVRSTATATASMIPGNDIS